MGFLKSLLVGLAGKYLKSLIEIAKVEVAIVVIKAIGGARRMFMLLSVWIFLLTLIAVGLAMIPLALCVFMPWEPGTKLIVALLFAFIYIAVPVFLLMSLMSERRWMKVFGANELVERFMHNKHEH